MQKRTLTLLRVQVAVLACCVAAIVLLVVALALNAAREMAHGMREVEGMAEDTAGTEFCQARLDTIGQAMFMYTQDWDGRLPPADSWCDALDSGRSHRALYSIPGVGRVFACPLASTPYRYAMNSKLSSAKLDEIPHADRTALVFETTKTHRNSNDALVSLRRPGPHKPERFENMKHVQVRGSVVLFADLSARFVPDDEELSP